MTTLTRGGLGMIDLFDGCHDWTVETDSSGITCVLDEGGHPLAEMIPDDERTERVAEVMAAAPALLRLLRRCVAPADGEDLGDAIDEAVGLLAAFRGGAR